MIEGIWNVIMDLLNWNRDLNHTYFRENIQPLYESMQDIYRDYDTGFREIRDVLREKSMPRDELLQFLSQRKSEYWLERDLTQEMTIKIGNAYPLGMEDEIHKGVISFITAVMTFFHASGNVAYMSWYSDLFKMVKGNIALGKSDIWTGLPIEGDYLQHLLSAIDSAIETELPRAMKEVNKSYVQLKSELL